MKQTLLTRLILAGLAGAALSAAQAGQIQASSVSIAREVITSDTQTILAPTISYRFAGDVDARGQTQTFQVQFTLAAGEWATLPGSPEKSIKVTNGITNAVINQGPAVLGTPTYTVSTVSLSTDKKTLYATIVVAQDAAAGNIQQPLVSINATTNTIAGVAAVDVSLNRASLQKLFAVTGDIAADFAADNTKCTDVKNLAVSFKHFTALSSPATQATSGNATEDEHLRGGATNAATLVVFPTNIKVNVAASTNAAYLTPGGNLTFSNNAAGGTSYVSGTVANLGNFAFAQNALGYDANLANQYVLAGVASGANAAGLDGIATAAAVVGDVETQRVDVAVTATNGFVETGTLTLHTNATCSAAIVGASTTVTALNAAGPITVSIPTASVAAAFGATGTNPVYVCYTVPGTKTIPSSSFTGVATIVKAAAGANVNEQNNACKAPLYSLGGGLKIDVRNYASSAETSGYKSVLRFINNSDSAPADVWAQFVHQDGKLGNWAKIADLPVRGSLNMTAAQIDAKLAAGSTATQAIGTAAPVASSTAPRLRITSTTGRSLRVQNYMVTPDGRIFEASGQQGVDYEGVSSRAPASEGQYQDQDANSGLNLGN